ncbi:MAG: PTS sugar transporter subunit IIA [Candidatus Eisenbacteria sp.]|nr:PTS sugar transporter subunit IIA [Candidatus Eisenbacteria bacterium]
MNLARLIKPELIRMELFTTTPPEPDEPYDRKRFVWSIKEEVIKELAEMVASSGRVGNARKLYSDLINREKKASTGLSKGVAIPHVRTREAREFIMAFARSTPGLEFDCLDGDLAHLFFVFVAPPYDDMLYLKIYKQMAEAFAFHDAARAFREARDEGEILRALKNM